MVLCSSKYSTDTKRGFVGEKIFYREHALAYPRNVRTSSERQECNIPKTHCENRDGICESLNTRRSSNHNSIALLNPLSINCIFLSERSTSVICYLQSTVKGRTMAKNNQMRSIGFDTESISPLILLLCISLISTIE